MEYGNAAAATNEVRAAAIAPGHATLEATVDAFLAECAQAGVTNVLQMEAKLGLPQLRAQAAAGESMEKADRAKWHPVLREMLGRETPPDPFWYVMTKHVDNPSPHRLQALLLLKALGYKCTETEAVGQ